VKAKAKKQKKVHTKQNEISKKIKQAKPNETSETK